MSKKAVKVNTSFEQSMLAFSADFSHHHIHLTGITKLYQEHANNSAQAGTPVWWRPCQYGLGGFQKEDNRSTSLIPLKFLEYIVQSIFRRSPVTKNIKKYLWKDYHIKLSYSSLMPEELLSTKGDHQLSINHSTITDLLLLFLLPNQFMCSLQIPIL